MAEYSPGTQAPEVLSGHARADGRGLWALHNKVSRLRSLVGRETIETAVGGYRLRASAGQLDLLRFGDLVSAAATAGVDEDARAALAEAIGL